MHRGVPRGSSAWKGALDVEISFKPTNDGLILEQAKSKDTEAAEPLSLELKSVDLPGWFDDDDEQVTSAVITGGAIRSDKESKQQTADVKALVDGWENTGRKLADGRPFVFRNEWRDYLTDTENLTDDGAYQRLKNIKGRPVGRLVAANVIEIYPPRVQGDRPIRGILHDGADAWIRDHQYIQYMTSTSHMYRWGGQG